MSIEEEIIPTEENQGQTNLRNIQKIKDQQNQNQNQENEDSSITNQNSNTNEIESNGKASKKIKKIKMKINNMEVYEKYHNLSIKELQTLLDQKNDDLIKLNEQKEKSKKILIELANKLNNTISSNSEILYEE